LLQVNSSDYDDMLNGKQMEASNETSMKIMFKDHSAGVIKIKFSLASPTKILVWIGYTSESLSTLFTDTTSDTDLSGDADKNKLES